MRRHPRRARLDHHGLRARHPHHVARRRSPEGDHLHTLTAKRKGLNIQFGGGPLPQHWHEAFEAVSTGSLDVTPMVGPSVGLDEVPAALDAARDANGPARIIVVP